MKLTGIQNLYNININPKAKNQAAPVFSSIYDTVSFKSAPPVKYVDENIPLLDGYSIKPIDGPDDFLPENMVMVHMTNYFPEDAEIKPVNISTKDENGKSGHRSTVHFAINHSVEEHIFGYGWQHMKYAILLPMDKVFQNTEKQNILGGELEDFFITGSVKLPDNSVIIKYNPDIQNGRMKITDASKTLDDFKGTKGIKIIETSNPDAGVFANKMIGKMGYTQINDIVKKLAGLSDEEARFVFDPKYTFNLMNNDFDKYFELEEAVDLDKLDDAGMVIKQGYQGFCEKFHITPWQHTYSPWGRSEMLIEAVKLAGLNGDKWEKLLFKAPEFEVIMFDDAAEITADDIKTSLNSAHNGKNTVDYKKEFLKIIDEIKKEVPKDRKLSFDIDVLREIIENAETPSSALKEIEERLNIKPMVSSKEYEGDSSNSELFDLINAVLCITDEQKEMNLPEYNGIIAL